MTITIEVEKALPEAVQTQAQDIADRALQAVRDLLDCSYDLTADLILLDDGSIHAINLENRGIDRSTDVLSFPYCEFEEPGNFDTIFMEPDSIHPETGELLLGDIVISVDHVVKQAREYDHSVEREYAFLLVHSLLHLCGYDHMKEDEREIMEEQQRKVMDLLQIYR